MSEWVAALSARDARDGVLEWLRLPGEAAALRVRQLRTEALKELASDPDVFGRRAALVTLIVTDSELAGDRGSARVLSSAVWAAPRVRGWRRFFRRKVEV